MKPREESRGFCLLLLITRKKIALPAKEGRSYKFYSAPSAFALLMAILPTFCPTVRPASQSIA